MGGMYGGSVGKIMRALDNALDNESVRSLDNLLVPQSDGRHVRRLGGEVEAAQRSRHRPVDVRLHLADVGVADGLAEEEDVGPVGPVEHLNWTGALDNGQVR